MEKVDIDVVDGFKRLLTAMRSPWGDSTLPAGEKDGYLTVSIDPNGKPNVMTQHLVSTGKAGHFGFELHVVIYGRNSYTKELLRLTPDFTLNVPRAGMEEMVDYCGKVSGRDEDKFQAMGLTAVPSRYVKSPIIAECGMHFECKVTWVLPMLPETSPDDEMREFAESHNMAPVLYTGIVQAAYADVDIANKL